MLMLVYVIYGLFHFYFLFFDDLIFYVCMKHVSFKNKVEYLTTPKSDCFEI